MQLNKKKELAASTLKVGKARIIFNKERLSDIKEAITKQDIKDLVTDKAITVKPEKGKKKVTKRKNRRRAGSIKQPVKNRKAKYVILTRKLRNFVRNLRDTNKISNDLHKKLRKEIRTSVFRSKAHLKERISQEEKE